MKPILYLPIIVALLFTPAFAQDIPAVAAPDSKGLAGEYIYSSGFVGAAFKVLADERFEYSSFSDCCDPVWRESGSYAVKDDLVHFKILTKSLNEYNLLDPEQASEAYRKLYNFKGTDLPSRVSRTEYDMQIVRWGGRIYLIDLDKIGLFAAAVNFGVEPRQRMINSNYLTTKFFLRRGDEQKAVVGKPVLPEAWFSYLHDPPIKAVVTKIDLQNRKKVYTVNKGSADGLKVGMYLLGGNKEPDYDSLLLVISAEDSSATLTISPVYRAADYQLGNSLVTKTIKETQ